MKRIQFPTITPNRRGGRRPVETTTTQPNHGENDGGNSGPPAIINWYRNDKSKITTHSSFDSTFPSGDGHR